MISLNEPGLVKVREPIRVPVPDTNAFIEKMDLSESTFGFIRRNDQFVYEQKSLLSDPGVQSPAQTIIVEDEFGQGKAEDMRALGVFILQLFLSPASQAAFSPASLQRSSLILNQVSPVASLFFFSFFFPHNHDHQHV